LSRSLYRTNTDVPDVCNKCFDKYCWNGDIDQGPLKQFVPAMKLEDERIDVASAAAERLGGVAVAVLVAAVMGAVNLA
jgi:lysophospholipase